MELTLGKRIAQNRKRLQLTQDQLADLLGVTKQAVSKWENDQSCPDITMLPKLAEIFGISTDALLGYEPAETVHTAEVVEDVEENGVHVQNGNWEFHWSSGRRSAVCFACTVVAVGILYLLAQLFMRPLSLWEVLWPTVIIAFGISGLLKKISFLPLGCVLLGGYVLADKFLLLQFTLDKKLLYAILIVLFGISLLVDAFKKAKKPHVNIKIPSNKNMKHDYTYDNDSFSYCSSFGEYTQVVMLDTLRYGDVTVSFGEYSVDLTEVEHVADDCHISATSSFGELRFIVPKKYRVISEHTTAFAALEIEGTPDDNPEGQIQLDGCVSFGQITIRYV